MKWPRFMHCIYAGLTGYFWLPCPLCGKMFGGHEWLPGNTLMLSQSTGQGVCPDCGDLAREQNVKLAKIKKLESACREADHVLEQVQLAWLPNSHNVRAARKAIADALESNIRFEDWEAEQMKDPLFRAAVEELEPEYQAAYEEIILGRLSPAMKLWQHEETGRITTSESQPWKGWVEIPTMYEDELPEGIPKEIYSWWFENSFVDGVRIGPKV